MLKEPTGEDKEELSILSKREKWILDSFFEEKKDGEKKEKITSKVKELEDKFKNSILPLQKRQKAAVFRFNSCIYTYLGRRVK